jgi:ABC-type multidrug transport system ATPase subunit
VSAPLLSVRGLVKSYGERRVVDELDLECRAGTVLGLLGPNGAGKTTTLRMLYGFVEPDAGRIVYDGRDFATHRSETKR